jgi:hypothetical protein
MEVPMYCDRCGKPLNPGAMFCTACGARILPGAALPLAGSVVMVPGDRVKRNIGLLAALWMLNGVVRLVGAFAFTSLAPMLFPRIFGVHPWGYWDFPFRWSFWPMSLGWAWIAALVGAFGLVHLTLAWGLHERKSWARPLGLAVGFLALLRFPLGTALGKSRWLKPICRFLERTSSR